MDLKHCLNSLNVTADWVSIREIKERITTRSARNGQMDTNNQVIDHGYMLEVMIDGQFGYAGTNTNHISAIQLAAEKAVKLAKKASEHKLYHFPRTVRPKAAGTYCSLYEKEFDDISINDLTSLLKTCSQKAKVSNKIINTLASAMMIERHSLMVSSDGSDIFQKMLLHSYEIAATAQDGSEIQRRSNGTSFLQQGAEAFNEEALFETAEKVGRESLELLSAEECPTGVYDIILAPDQLYLQVHESIGHPLEMDRILGDERNYAGWSFVKPQDFGTLQYGSPLLNVTFDPHVDNEAASYNFDDIGNKATKEYLIKDGILVRGLGSLESQERLKIPGVANARLCSWNRPPIDRMANINIEPGQTSFEDMISQVENGIFMETNRSWSIDDYRNKFQFGCEYARRIENGKLTIVLKNPNYRGVSTPFWNNLKAVGDKNSHQIWGSPNCGKGEPNQVIRVGHAVPVCLFKDIEVFGGA